MSRQTYNAFISYRRTERDTAVAKEVQQSLEHFRIPRGIRTSSGKERIDRIFRDQEELEITSNLSRRIEDALEASEYLIVICSPGYNESKWCLHELETFLQLRGRDHVLCVLSEGEPPGVFPELLLHSSEEVSAEDGTRVTVEMDVEPLACDYRGDFRAARRTELPRLAAVLLGCGYDELVMRRERYRRRRLAAVFSATFVLAAAAITWLLWSNAQINRNYRQSQISESRLLAMKSLDAFSTQDRLEALTTAMQALTGETEDRPITDEAQYAMSQASYAYSTAYQWLETWRIDDINDIADYFVSRDHSCIVTMDRTGLFRCFERVSRKEICSFRATENTVPYTPIEGKDGELICFDGAAVVSANYRSGTISWRQPIRDLPRINYSGGGVYMSSDGAHIAVNGEYVIFFINEEGVPYSYIPLPESVSGYISDLCWSLDDRQIAAMIKITGEDLHQVGIFDVETSSFTLLEPAYRNVDLFQFDEDGILYVLGDNREYESSTVGKATTLIPIQYELSAFQNGEVLWQRQIREKTLTDKATLQIRQIPEKRLVLALGSTIRAYDAEGAELGTADIRKEILTLQPEETSAVNYVTLDGELGSADLSVGSTLMLRIFPSKLERITTIQEDDEISISYVVLADGNLCIFESVSDEEIRFFEEEGSQYQPDGFLRDGSRLLIMSDRKLRFCDLEEKKQDTALELSRDDAWHLLTERDGTAWLLRIAGEDGAYSLVGLDMTTGETVREDSLPGADFFVENPFMHGPMSREEVLYLDHIYTGPAPVAVQGDCVWFHDRENDNRLWCYHLSDGSAESLDLTETLGENRRLIYEENGFLLPSPLVISGDGKTIFTACTNMEEGIGTAVLIRPEDGRVTVLPGTPDDLSSAAFTENGIVYAGVRRIWFCSLDGELQNSISFTGDNPISFSWNRGRLYCVFPDSSLTIYENGEAIRTIPLSFDLSMDIIDGKAFRYEFSDTRLYLYCGSEMNVVMLNSDGETAVYYAGSVLAHLEDRQELLVFSYNREKLKESGDMHYYLGSFREYSVGELIDRARIQLETYVPGKKAGRAEK